MAHNSQMTKTTLKKELYLRVLESYKEEYSRLLDKWRDFERKAQINITLASALIAAIFAFIRSDLNHQGIFLNLTIVTIIVSLFLSVYRSIGVLKIKTIKTPLSGSQIQEQAEDLIRVNYDIDENFIEIQASSFYDNFSAFKMAIESIKNAIEAKNRYLSDSHNLLLLSLFLIGLYSIVFLIS